MKRSSSFSTSTSSGNEGEHKNNQNNQIQNVHINEQNNHFINYLLHIDGGFSTDVVEKMTKLVSLNQMSSVISTCHALNNADLTLYVPPSEWNDGDDVRKTFTIMTATQTTKWIRRIDTSKVTKMKLGEKEYNDQDKPTIVTDAWLHFTASGKFPLLTSLDLSGCNNITETGTIELVRRCPQITNLDFTECEWVTDASIVALSFGCKQLNTLNMVGCNKDYRC